MNRRVVLPEAKSQRRRVPSHDPERQNWPSDEITTSETKWECPFNRLFGMPYWLNIELNSQEHNLDYLRFIASQLPHNDSLVTRSREEHVREDWCCSDLGDPTIVPLEGSFQCHLFRHIYRILFLTEIKQLSLSITFYDSFVAFLWISGWKLIKQKKIVDYLRDSHIHYFHWLFRTKVVNLS